MKIYNNYIDGKFVEAIDYFQIENPSTGALLAKVPRSDGTAVTNAVAAAKRAHQGWGSLPAIERASHLRAIATKVRESRDKLADTIVKEQGKTRALAATEVAVAAEYFDYMSEWARRIEGEIIPSDRPNETILMNYKPIGVVAGILPWNFPFFLIARKVAPAILTGNTIVVKPAEETPINALEFAALVAETDLPAGVFNLVVGPGASTGEALTSNPDVDLITFTGSVATGKRIMATAASNLTRVNLELGGKAPAIVLEDADLDLAAQSIWESRIINTGQVCNCAEKVFVQRSVHDALLAKLREKFESTKYGDPSTFSELDMGPLINDASLKRVTAVVESAVEQGASVVCGGGPDDAGRGYFFKPTLLSNVSTDMDVMRNETFGPVLPVMAVEDLDEAIRLSNDSDYGLTSSIYTNDLNSAMRATRELEYGETYINRENFEAIQGFHAGRKQSGIGGADGKHGLMEFLETHMIYIQGR